VPTILFTVTGVLGLRRAGLSPPWVAALGWLSAPPTIHAPCAARRSERLGPLHTAHTEPDNLRTLRAAIEAPTKHADSACPPLDEEVELTITAIADSIQGSA